MLKVITATASSVVWAASSVLGARRGSRNRYVGPSSSTATLLEALRELVFEPTGSPVAWLDDPPRTVAALRRNEIAIPVVERL